jgi:hypothetical protein
MLGSVYAHIFGQENAKRDVHALSVRLYEYEDPDFDVEEWIASAHPLDDHALEHPLATALANEDWSGPGAALAYAEDVEEAEVPAVVRWMMTGGYKGYWDTEAEFCEDQWSGEIADHMELWTNSQQSGFPLGVDWISAIDWEEIADRAVGGPVMGSRDQVFYSIECEGGVYIFDMSVQFEDYREGR